MHSLPLPLARLGRVFSTLLILGCAPWARGQSPFEWETSSPEEQGVDGARIAQMLDRMRTNRMAVHSFLLVRNGYLVAEYYQAPYNAATPHPMYSVSKSLTSAAIGIALELGYIDTLDERVLDILQLPSVQNPSPNKSALALRHLLTMSAGLGTDTFSRFGSSRDWVKTYMDLAVTEPPGTRFVYDSGATMMLSAVLQRKTGMSLLAFAERHLFQPLGFSTYTWERGPNDLTAGGWGLRLTPRDMAKFGLLYLNEGRWQGQQLVPAEWVRLSSARQISTGAGSGFWAQGYGYQFWLNPFGGYRADGYGGQFIIILPEKNTVAVFTAGYSDGGPPLELMRDYVVPALLEEDNPDLPGVPSAAGVPVLHLQPASLAVAGGEDAVFRVVAAGQDLAYAWTVDGQPIAGASNPVLVVPKVNASACGMYQVQVENRWGRVTSTSAELSISPSRPRARLVNLSARALTGSGEQTLIVGFGVGRGSADQGLPVLLRGVGPSLAPLGVTGALPNPDLFLWRETLLAGNRSWPAWVGPVSERVGAFTLPPGSRDAASYAVLNPGPYTFHVPSADPARTGVALAECYEAATSPNDLTPELVNLSARSRVSPGEGTLIAGFVVGGEGTKRVLVRAVGPSLRQFGVQAVLEDPVLVLHGPAGLLDENDDWPGTADLQDTFAAVGAFPLPAQSKDAVLLTRLAPGAYTVHLRGKTNDTGTGLLELYSLPD